MAILAWIEQLSLSSWVRESGSIWAFPMLLFAHTLGVAVVAGGSTVISLALLGMWPASPRKPLEKLYPAILMGFGVNAITGTLLFMGDATTRGTNPDFYIKMMLVVAGVGVLLLIRRQVFNDPNLDKLPVGRRARILAWTSLIC
jgi:hypothetical protein